MTAPFTDNLKQNFLLIFITSHSLLTFFSLTKIENCQNNLFMHKGFGLGHSLPIQALYLFDCDVKAFNHEMVS